MQRPTPADLDHALADIDETFQLVLDHLELAGRGALTRESRMALQHARAGVAGLRASLMPELRNAAGRKDRAR